MSVSLNSALSLAVLSMGGAYVRPQRKIGAIIPDVVVEEVGQDDMEITRHPVERSAAISDHAFKQPATLRVRVGFSPSGSSTGSGPIGAAIAGVSALFATLTQSQSAGLNNIYQRFLDYQTDAELLTVVTGKRTYQNMLVRSVGVTTDAETENALIVDALLQQVILVDAQVVTNVPANDLMAFPQQTGTPAFLGPQIAVPNPGNYNAAGSP